VVLILGLVSICVGVGLDLVIFGLGLVTLDLGLGFGLTIRGLVNVTGLSTIFGNALHCAL